MARPVKCPYCQNMFDRDKVPFVQLPNKRYAHTSCYNQEQSRLVKEDLDKMALESYIKKLFELDYVNPRILRQIKDFQENYHYSYNGIRQTLIYYFEIKKGDLSKANGGIGIVPYVYEEAKKYYEALYIAKEKNKNKNIETYKPVIEEVHIPSPQRILMLKKKFSFLDEEEETEDITDEE